MPLLRCFSNLGLHCRIRTRTASVYGHALRGQAQAGFAHRVSTSTATREFKVVLDNETLYIPQELAEALGWNAAKEDGSVPLTLRGWAPHYFPITRKGSDSDTFAQNTLENSRDPKLQEALEYLKDR
ncbi:hypothetical protein PYCCODRAFT_1473970 [Trametes coccinea BRFM310]|uniref:Uncharacterized protein n=1 Tax=Trametes coccinea (strain BRFM310) TaxID=1353009 RepID=A0A1Y2J1X8_TRAC3|nr:hypothetical protein PYCCODRAFT_1473970 [Trametes coccinea BRFM310]